MPLAETTVPPGVVQSGGEWYFEDYTPGKGVASLGSNEAEGGTAPLPAADEKRSILDLFKN